MILSSVIFTQLFVKLKRTRKRELQQKQTNKIKESNTYNPVSQIRIKSPGMIVARKSEFRNL